MAKAYGRPPWMIGNPTEEELYRELELLDLEEAIAALPQDNAMDAPKGFEMEWSEPELIQW